MDKVLSVEDLSVSFNTRGTIITAVNNLSFSLQKNEVLGIVGESGSGKSQTVLSLMGLLESNGEASGSAIFKNKEILGLPDKDLNKIRGNEIAMIFQDPMSSLNPYITIGEQMSGVLRQHRKNSKKEARDRCIEMLSAVKVPSPDKRIDGYSFELSGGMRQRVMIATALLTDPDLLIADEPTTALDVTVQEKILDLILEVKEKFLMSVVLITHDLGVVARTCDNVLVLKNGIKQEYGDTEQIFYSPKAEHTRELLLKSRELEKPLQKIEPRTRPQISATIKGLSVFFPMPKNNFLSKTEHLRAVNNLSFEIKEGEVLGVVGESGSGKSTLARSILKLQKPTKGSISLFGENILGMNNKQIKKFRKNIQVVFQDPFSSLNPRMTVAEILTEPLDSFFPKTTKTDAVATIKKNLADVGLETGFLGRYPHELSGGQCQRVAIARAIAPEPNLIFLDEPTSSLDLSVRGEVLSLLNELQNILKITYVFVSHDLEVVRAVSDRIVVMYRGKIVEEGSPETIFKNPSHPYTQKLLAASEFSLLKN